LTSPQDDGREAELHSALKLLQELIPPQDWEQFMQAQNPSTVFTNLVVIWMLILQRLGGGQSLENVLKETFAHFRHILPQTKRVRERTLSENTSGFSQARQRLPLAMVERLVDGIAEQFQAAYREELDDRMVYVIDGTTQKLSPTSDLRHAFPPATNQHGQTVWPILMISVAHELQSGVALRPEFGAMYGSKNTSEAVQAKALAGRIPRGSIVLADSGYGIFDVAYALRSCEHEFLIRLTDARYKSMVRTAQRIEDPDPKTASNTQRHRLLWKPSKRVLGNHPELPADASLAVELHAVAVGQEMLYLVTSMTMTSTAAAELYQQRYTIEHSIRDWKVTLDIESIRAKTAEMVQKELLCSLVAYNLVVQLRREAAKIANLPPRRLSFTQVWSTMKAYLLHESTQDAAAWLARYAEALRIASRSVLPDRPGRSYPRRALAKRPKSTKFMQKTAKKPPANPTESPPHERK
jgi:hypothetical protein